MRRLERDHDATRNWLGLQRVLDHDSAQPAYGLRNWLRHNEMRTSVRRYPPMVECVVWDAPARHIRLEGDTHVEEFIVHET